MDDVDFSVRLRAFSYRRDKPCREANISIDAREFPDPRFIPDLKGQDGRSVGVQMWMIERDPAQEGRMEKALTLAIENLKQRVKDGYKIITVDVGCATGEHQSVVYTDLLEQRIFKAFPNLYPHVSIMRTRFSLGPSDNDQPIEQLSEAERGLPREFLGLLPKSRDHD
jgi:RNase adaptor protein for sRNA GlmZ degradation